MADFLGLGQGYRYDQIDVEADDTKSGPVGLTYRGTRNYLRCDDDPIRFWR